MAQTHYGSIVNSKGTATDDDTSANVSVAGVTDANLSHVTEDFVAQEGVVDLSVDCKVTPQGTPDMTVNAAAGTAYIQSSTWTQNSNTLRYYRDVCTVGASGSELTIGANASGSTRIDKICLKIDTAVISGGTVDNTGSNVASYLVVAGTPGAGAPATPADHLALAEITVANGETSITSGEISDSRQKAYMVDWQPTNESPVYSAWDSSASTGEITIDAGGLNRYHIGQKITFLQPTDGRKYGIVTKVADTTLTAYLGTDYDLDSEAITELLVSSVKAPFGFPMDPIKWTQTVSDTTSRSQSSPVAGTWYNLGSVNIEIPIGAWDVSYNVVFGYIDTSTGVVTTNVTLSTGNASESNALYSTASQYRGESGAAEERFFVPATKLMQITLATADVYYFNTKTGGAGVSAIYNINDQMALVIKAVCAYL